MNLKILLISAVATASFASCSTAYKSGQTPDDVYYSPTRVIEEDQQVKKQQDEPRIDPEEREIRMATRDRRWRDWDYDCNCDCNYDPYRYGYTYGYYYNPYYYPYPVYSGYTYYNPKNTTPRMTNLSSYNSTSLTTISNPKTGSTSVVSSRNTYNNSNNSGSGYQRRILVPNSNNSTYSAPSNNNSTRTYSPPARSSSSSGSSSSGSSSSSGTSVSRPARGN
ncbi:MAG: hypothetical protein QM687_14825 [Ferruginibacter sp.]